MKLNRIRAVLEDKGISQTWLAKKLGRSFSTVNAYVCNRSQPNLTTLLEIAQFLVCGYERTYHGQKGTQ